MLSLVPLIGFVCSLAAGFIVEKVKVHYILSVAFLLELGVLMVLLQASSAFAIFLLAVLWGISQGLFMICFGVIWPNYFGRAYLGSIRSVAATVTVLGSALGPLPFGMAYDFYGGYAEVLISMMLFPLLAMIAAILSPPPAKP